MKFLSRNTVGPIGIDFGSRVIKAVQLTGSHDEQSIVAAAVVDRQQIGGPLTRDEVTDLRDTLRSAGFKGNQIVIAAPEDHLLSAFLELPPREAGVPLEQIAKMEFSRMHRCDPQAVELSFWDLPASGRAGTTTQVMAVGCRHSDSNDLLDLIESSGFYVRAIDTHSWSILRACRSLLADDGMTMILDVGYASSKLILANNKVVTYERILAEAGVETLIKAFEAKTEIDRTKIEQLIRTTTVSKDEDAQQDRTEEAEAAQHLMTDHYWAVADELKVSMSYAAHRYREAGLRGMLIVGGGSETPGLADFMNRVLEIEVRTITMRDVAVCDDPDATDTGLAVAATGLAGFVER